MMGPFRLQHQGWGTQARQSERVRDIRGGPPPGEGQALQVQVHLVHEPQEPRGPGGLHPVQHPPVALQQEGLAGTEPQGGGQFLGIP